MCLLDSVDVTHLAAQSGCLCALFPPEYIWEKEKVLTSTFAAFSLTLESLSVSFDSRTAAAHMVTWGQLIIYSMLARKKPMRITLIIQ